MEEYHQARAVELLRLLFLSARRLILARSMGPRPELAQLLGAATCSAPLLLASRRLPGERLCERDREAIWIDADSQPDALVCLLSRCADKLRAPCGQFPIRGCEILNREAD
jgi:hypothetical protein